MPRQEHLEASGREGRLQRSSGTAEDQRFWPQKCLAQRPNGGERHAGTYSATTVDATTVIDGKTLFWCVSCHFFGASWTNDAAPWCSECRHTLIQRAPNMRKWINIGFGYLRVLHKSELKSDPKLDSLGQGLVNVPFWGYWTSPYSSHYRPYT